MHAAHTRSQACAPTRTHVCEQLFVAKYFSPEAKATVVGMIGEVLSVMKTSIETNDWLTAPTKATAAAKLAKFRVKIGYPDRWKVRKLHILHILQAPRRLGRRSVVGLGWGMQAGLSRLAGLGYVG